MNFTSGQYKNQARPGVFTSRDWSALEKRLSETREMLKEILANLQVVLHNLRAVNRLGKDPAGAGPGFGAKTAFAYGAGTGRTGQAGQTGQTGQTGRMAGPDKFARSKREYGHGPFGQTGQANRFKTTTTTTGFARAGSQAFEPGGFEGGNKNAKNPYARPEPDAGANRAAAQGAARGPYTTGASAHDRARPNPKDSFSAGTQANAHGKANTASGDKAGATPGGKTHAASGGAAGGASSGASSRQNASSQTGSSRREFRRPYRPRGEMTVERARAILCLSSARDERDIKSAYRKKARQYHPDLGGDEEMMKDLNLAYDLLLQYHFSHQAPTERNQ